MPNQRRRNTLEEFQSSLSKYDTVLIDSEFFAKICKLRNGNVLITLKYELTSCADNGGGEARTRVFNNSSKCGTFRNLPSSHEFIIKKITFPQHELVRQGLRTGRQAGRQEGLLDRGTGRLPINLGLKIYSNEKKCNKYSLFMDIESNEVRPPPPLGIEIEHTAGRRSSASQPQGRHHIHITPVELLKSCVCGWSRGSPHEARLTRRNIYYNGI